MAARQKKTSTRTRSLPRQIYLGCFVVAFSFWIFIFSYTYPVYVNQWQVSSLKISLHTPRYLSVNDENVIRISLENTHDQTVNANVRLTNDGTVISFLGSETNVFYSGFIKGNSQVNRQLLVFIPLSDNVLGNMTELRLHGNIENASWDKKLPLRIAPIPNIKSIGNYLNGIFLAAFGSAIGLINDALRQSLQPNGKKK